MVEQPVHRDHALSDAAGEALRNWHRDEVTRPVDRMVATDIEGLFSISRSEHVQARIKAGGPKLDFTPVVAFERSKFPFSFNVAVLFFV